MENYFLSLLELEDVNEAFDCSELPDLHRKKLLVI